jgi:glycosyltransferase involved in cell wall biosynthesis
LNNETIFGVVKDARALGYEVIVVDDGSTPPLATRMSADERTHIITHPRNYGKGAAILNGAAKAKELGYSYIVSLDADGQHLPSEVEKLLRAAEGLDEVIVIGARDFDISNVPGGSRIGRAISNFWARLDTSCDITDSLSGFRLYPVSILELPTKRLRFDWEMEVLVRHAWLHRPIIETLVRCYYPRPEERVSHFRKWRDTMAIIWVHIRLMPLRMLLLKGYI